MYSVSNAYKTAIRGLNPDSYVLGTITLLDSTIITIIDADINSLDYINQCTPDDGFSVGYTHTGEQGITIYDDMTNYRRFKGATIELKYYLKISATEYEGVPLGIFEVVEATRPTATTIKLVGYDNMTKFDVDYPLNDETTEKTPFQRLKDICVALGVELWVADAQAQFELSNMPNGTQKHVLVWSPEIITARDYLDYLCQLLCGFATIDKLGRLRIVCWKLKGTITGYAIPDNLRKKSTFNDTVLKYSAVNMSVSFIGGDDVFVKNVIAPEVPTGAGEVLSMYTNALIRGSLYNQAQTILDNIASVITNTDPENGTVMRWTPCDIQYTGDPALDLGDWVTYTGYTAGDGIEVPIHKIDWKYRGWQRLETLDMNRQAERENNANRVKQEELAMVIKSGVGAKGTGENAEIFNDYENNIASGSYSHASGHGTTASGDTSIAMGDYATASGMQSVAIGGYNTQASGENSVAIGRGKAIGDNSLAVGSGCEAKGRQSVALGNGNITNVDYSFAVGSNNIAGVLGSYGDSSIAMGYRNKATGTRAIAMGYMCEAGSHAIAMGEQNKSTERSSLTIGGVNNTASGSSSAVLGGQSNKATNYYSASMGGYGNEANGTSAVVLGGDNNKANYQRSAIVGGYNNIASGTSAVAMGEEVIAKGSNQLALGKYNVEDTTNQYALVVGGGKTVFIGGKYVPERKNIFTVDWAGNVECVGTVNSTGDIYSTTETKTNQKWLDGKPIHRKLFEIPNASLTAGLTQIALDVDVETITNLHATIERTASTSLINVNSYWCSDLIPIATSQIIKIECVDGNLEIRKQNDMSADYENLTITIEFTKTTD